MRGRIAILAAVAGRCRRARRWSSSSAAARSTRTRAGSAIASIPGEPSVDDRLAAQRRPPDQPRGRRQGRGPQLPPRSPALRRRTAARRGPHPLRPQPRPRLRRPGETAAGDQQPARQRPPGRRLLRLPAVLGAERRARRTDRRRRQLLARRPGRRSTTTTCRRASTASSSTWPRTTAPPPPSTPSPTSRSCRRPGHGPEALQGRQESPAPRPRHLSGVAVRAPTAQEPNTSLCIVRSMRTYRRLMGFLRPYRRQLWGSLAFAWAAMGMTVLIPWLIGRAVNAIEDGDKPDLLPLALAIVGAAILRLGLTVVRRLVAGKVSLAVEFDLRQLFYAHLQRLELGFFDSQQTGQLMSRATVDLQSIRFFLGYGLIFITQNLLTIVLASAVMFAINPLLALIALAPAPVRRLHRLALQPRLAPRPAGGPAADRRADRGGRGERLRDPHRQGLRPRGVPAAPLPARRRPGLRPEHLLDPAAGLLLAADRAAAAARHRPGAAGRRPRGDRRQPQPRRLHRLLHLPGDAGRADADARRGDGDGAAGGRLRQPPVRDPRPRAGDREPARGARRCPPAAAGRAARRDAALRRRRRRR